MGKSISLGRVRESVDLVSVRDSETAYLQSLGKAVLGAPEVCVVCGIPAHTHADNHVYEPARLIQITP